jgi:hypothetical protein
MQHRDNYFREVIIDYLVEKYLNRVINDSLMMPTSNRHILPRTIISKKTIKRIQNRVDYEKSSFKEGMEDTKNKFQVKMKQQWIYCMATMMLSTLINKVHSIYFVIFLVLSSFIKKQLHLLSSPTSVWKINQVDVTEHGLGYQSDNLHYVVSFGNVLHGTDIFLMNYPSKTYHIITIINLIR